MLINYNRQLDNRCEVASVLRIVILLRIEGDASFFSDSIHITHKVKFLDKVIGRTTANLRSLECFITSALLSLMGDEYYILAHQCELLDEVHEHCLANSVTLE